MKHTLLETIASPADLRRLSRTELPQLATELRDYLLHSVSRTGGHLSSNLGTVELTIALHYVFDTPRDRLVWDVGHQTYPHKILTGRRERMGSLRQLGGISGFPRRDESEYDTFGTAHSSTSISAALGMALASKLKAETRHAVAIIGDGAMSAGMAFEALNNAGVSHADMLVVLNDNDMSISPPVGALNRYLARLMSGKFYGTARDTAKQVLKAAPPLYELARRFEEHAKGMVVPGTIFEELGFNYVGPIDGHDLGALIPTLENLRDKKGPQFLHVVTKKGLRLQARRGRPGRLPRARQVRSGRGAEAAAGRAQDHLHPGLRPVAVRHGRRRRTSGRHHAGDARGLGPGRVRAALPVALPRRRHCRAACSDLRRRPGLRGPQAGGGDLLDLPAAGLRPADPRRGAAEPAGGLRARPRGPGRGGRRDPRRRVRHRLPALHPEHERAHAQRRGASAAAR